MAKTICGFCGQKAKPSDEFCQNCGARLEDWQVSEDPPHTEYAPYDELREFPASAPSQASRHSAPSPLHQQAGLPGAAAGYSPVPDYTLRRRSLPGAVVGICAAFVLVSLVFVTLAFPRNSPEDSDSEVHHREDSSPLLIPPAQAESFDQILERMNVRLEQGDGAGALDTVLQLLTQGCDEPWYYRTAAFAMANHDEYAAAFRLHLLVYGLTGDEGDFRHATASASPEQVIVREALRDGISGLLGKPVEQLTWEDIGRIRSYEHNSDSFSVGLLPRAGLTEQEYRDSLHTTPLENDPSLTLYFFYGLTDLSVNVSISNLEYAGFPALRSLRSLTVSSLHRDQDLTCLWGAGSLEELSVGGSGLISLTGLEDLPGVHTLELRSTGMESLAQIADYPQIKKLTLERNSSMHSILPLANLPSLTSLSVIRGEFRDLHLLGELPHLQELTVRDTDLKEISSLFGLEQLIHLELTGNSQLLSVAGLSSLQSLQSLALSCGSVEGQEEIAALSGLKSLSLASPNTLSMVSGLIGLEELTISSPSMLDSLAPLTGLTSLHTLSLRSASSRANANIYDYSLSALAGLPLRRLELSGLSVYTDCSAIFSISTLEHLDISGCDLNVPSYAGALGGLEGLRTLRLNGTRLLYNVWVSSDGFFTNISYDDADMNAAAAPLSGLSSLTRLECRGIKLSDLSFVSGLGSLAYLDASDNYITDPSPLAQCPSLVWVDLSDNPVRDWSPLDSADFIVIS